MHMLVFPYSCDCEPIIRHTHLLNPGYEIVALVSPGGWGLAGKRVVLGNSEICLFVYESLQDVVEEFDSLFIPTFEAVEAVENLLVDQMVKLIPYLTYVYCAAKLTDVNQARIKDACRQASSLCIYICFSERKSPDAYGLSPTNEKYPSLQQPTVPVVTIAGLWEKTDKLEVSLALREHLLKNGYRVTQIGSRDGCEMLGFHSFPTFMYRKDIDAADKVFLFNRWIMQITDREKPDLVLLAVPGATQDLNAQFTRGFGLLHSQVFKAIAPDVLVMCTFFCFDPVKALEEISQSCRYRFGTPVDVFHMSNLFIDISTSEEFKHVVTNNIYRETVSEILSKKSGSSPIPIFNTFDNTDCDRMVNLVVGKIIPKDVQVIS